MAAKTTKNKTKPSPQIISYLTIRKAIGILGIALPVLLVLGTVLCGCCKEVQNSISAYYHTGMRNLFVGILCAVALFLFAYKGYGRTDNIAGNLGCVFALGVAFFPTSFDGPFTSCLPKPIDTGILSNIHFISAALFFIVLAFFCIVLFTKTKKKNPGPRKLRRNLLYRICGFIILGSIALIALYSSVLSEKWPALQKFHLTFWFETIALWAFGVSWLTKGEVILTDSKEEEQE